LNLSRLTTAEGLELPNSIGGYLSLSSLTTAEGLELPDGYSGTVYVDTLIDNKSTPAGLNEFEDLVARYPEVTFSKW